MVASGLLAITRANCTTLYRVFRGPFSASLSASELTRFLSEFVRSTTSNKYGDCFDVYHAIEPRSVRDSVQARQEEQGFLSNYLN